MPTLGPERGLRGIIALSCVPNASPGTVLSADPAAPLQATTLARPTTVRWGMQLQSHRPVASRGSIE